MLAVIGVVAAVSLSGSSGHSGANPPSSAKPRIGSFPIAATSSFRPVTGDVFVVYKDGKRASARLRGDIRDASGGEVARLYAQQYPYHRAPAQAGSLVLQPAGGAAEYSFKVTPALATPYQVKLFRSSTARTPLATSAVSTVYVALTGKASADQKCSRPVCHETFHIRVRVPAQAMSIEIATRLTSAIRPATGTGTSARRTPSRRTGSGCPGITAAATSTWPPPPSTAGRAGFRRRPGPGTSGGTRAGSPG